MSVTINEISVTWSVLAGLTQYCTYLPVCINTQTSSTQHLPQANMLGGEILPVVVYKVAEDITEWECWWILKVVLVKDIFLSYCKRTMCKQTEENASRCKHRDCSGSNYWCLKPYFWSIISNLPLRRAPSMYFTSVKWRGWRWLLSEGELGEYQYGLKLCLQKNKKNARKGISFRIKLMHKVKTFSISFFSAYTCKDL